MKRSLILMAVVALLSAVAVAQCARPAAATPASPAVAFLTRTLRLLAGNHYAAAWQTLNPVDQAAAPLDAYVACESKSPIPGTLTSVPVVRRWNEAIRIAPEASPVSTVAVAFVIRLTGVGVSATVPVTAHAVRVDGTWTWVLPPARLQMYRDNAC